MQTPPTRGWTTSTVLVRDTLLHHNSADGLGHHAGRQHRDPRRRWLEDDPGSTTLPDVEMVGTMDGTPVPPRGG